MSFPELNSQRLFLDLQRGQSLQKELQENYQRYGTLDADRFTQDLAGLLYNRQHLQLHQDPNFTPIAYYAASLSSQHKSTIYALGIKLLLDRHAPHIANTDLKQGINDLLSADLRAVDDATVQAISTSTVAQCITSFSLLQAIPPEHRCPIVFQSLLYYTKVCDQYPTLLDKIVALPTLERAECSVYAAALLQTTRAPFPEQEIWEAVTNTPSADRAEVCTLAQKLVRNPLKPGEIKTLVQLIQDIPQETRAKVCICTQSLALGISKTRSILKILELIGVIPAEMQAEMTSTLPPLFASMRPAPASYRLALIQCICGLADHAEDNENDHIYSPAERLDIYMQLQLWLPLIALDSKADIHGIFRFICSIPHAERATFCAQTAPLLKNLEDRRRVEQLIGDDDTSNDMQDLLDILQKILSLEVQERADFCTQALLLLPTILDWDEKELFIYTLASISKEDRAHVLLQALTLLEDISNGSGTGLILENVSCIPKNEREALISQVQPLLVGIQDGNDRAYILKGFCEVHAEERPAFISQTLILLEKIEHASTRAAFLSMLGRLNPRDSAENFIQLTLPCLSAFKGSGDKIIILNALVNVLKKERAQIILQAQPLVEQMKEAVARATFFTALADILKTDREECCRLAAAQVTDANHIANLVALLHTIHLLPTNDRSPAVLQAVTTLLANEDLQLDYRVILYALGQITPIQRAPTLLKAAPSCHMTDNLSLRAALLHIYADDSLTQAWTKAHTYLKQLEDEQWNDDDQQIALAVFLTFIPPVHWETFIATADDELVDSLSLLKKLTLIPLALRTIATLNTAAFALIRFSGLSVQNTTHLLRLIPLQSLEKVIALVDTADAPTYTYLEDFLMVICAQESFKEMIYEHLYTCLATETYPIKKWALIQSIFAYQLELQLQDTHPLFEYALQEALSCDPKVQHEPKNPYRIYNYLKTIVAKEALFNLVLAPVCVEGEMVVWQLDELRKKSLWQGYTFGDLPTGITFKTLQGYFTALEDRVQRLQPEGLAEVEEYIAQSMGDEQNPASLKLLKEELLDKPTVASLFVYAGKPNDAISANTFQLYVVVQAIGETDDKLASGALLTEREEMLLRLAASMRECDIGQKSGLTKFYNALPIAKKLGLAAIETNAQLLDALVDTAVQNTLQNAISNEELLKAYGQQDVMEQAVHPILCLKNRFYRQIGLKHQLQLDSHTYILSDKLLIAMDEEPEKVALSILQQATPAKAVDQIILESTKLFEADYLAQQTAREMGIPFKQKTLYSAISEFMVLENLASKDKRDISYYISFREVADKDGDIDFIPDRLTMACAFLLWKKCAYGRAVVDATDKKRKRDSSK